MAESELDRIDPEPVTVKLTTGYEVGIQRLKTRQFFRLLKVLTRGVGPAVVQSGLDFSKDQEAFGQNLLAMTLMAIPEAEQQFIEFLTSMCSPVGLHEAHGRARLSKQQAEDNQTAVAEMVEELNNPELEDLLDLAEAIVRQEAPEIQALGKRVASLLELARKTGQLEDKSTAAGDGQLAGAFAGAFDLLSHEYGWTDERILDLPLCRLRQCIAAASARRELEQHARLRLAEWQVKVVCTFIGAQAQIDTEKTNGRNPLVDLAQSLDILGGKTEAERELDAMRGPKVADRWEDDPRLQAPAGGR